MAVPAWYFVLFVAIGGGIGDSVKSRSKSDAFFYSTKSECTRVLGQIAANRSEGYPFHSMLKHEDFEGVHRHSWNKTCRRIPSKV